MEVRDSIDRFRFHMVTGTSRIWTLVQNPFGHLSKSPVNSPEYSEMSQAVQDGAYPTSSRGRTLKPTPKASARR